MPWGCLPQAPYDPDLKQVTPDTIIQVKGPNVETKIVRTMMAHCEFLLSSTKRYVVLSVLVRNATRVSLLKPVFIEEVRFQTSAKLGRTLARGSHDTCTLCAVGQPNKRPPATV